MHAITPFLVAASMATTAVRANIEAQYYTDFSCTEYLTTVTPFDDDKCYQYQYSGVQSANVISSINNNEVYCTWYEGENCSGDNSGKVYGQACTAGSWQSMKCYYQ
jgi:hypothetical protein